jgi:hypothetical protein
MKNLFTTTLMIGAIMFLNACSGHNLKKYDNQKPEMDIKEYFTGPIKAWGLVQNRKGEVVRRFDVDMVGTWNGNVGTLDETFEYYDGETQKRIWTITKISDNKYEGRADDILDKATGELNGNAMRWAYQMDLPVGGKTYRVTFDDWMFMMHDDILVNRSYIKKFGITMAELTLFMQKQ